MVNHSFSWLPWFLSVSHLAEVAAYPSRSVTEVDVHSPAVVVLKGGSYSNISESISIHVCKTGYGGAKSAHGWRHYSQFTLQLKLREMRTLVHGFGS